VHVATPATPQPNLLLERGINFSTRGDLLGDFSPGAQLIIVALDVGEDEGARVKALCQAPHLSLNGRTTREVCVAILVAFGGHCPCAAHWRTSGPKEVQVGQQLESRMKFLSGIRRFVLAEPHTSCFM
jgi:hypothetical protein